MSGERRAYTYVTTSIVLCVYYIPSPLTRVAQDISPYFTCHNRLTGVLAIRVIIESKFAHKRPIIHLDVSFI